MVELGIKVKDNVTGFEGMATARTVYLFGCVRVLVEPMQLKDGLPIDAQWFDEQRLTEQSEATSGGSGQVPPSRDAPKR